jgi:hypothetical protein
MNTQPSPAAKAEADRIFEPPRTDATDADLRSAYASELLARVGTLDGGQALVVVLRSILERLERIEALASAPPQIPEELSGLVGNLVGADGKLSLSGVMGLLK